ncbi:MAG: putative bifunctional diguanylate cyclase/phosphodiesterase [Novosphingobium sp.]
MAARHIAAWAEPGRPILAGFAALTMAASIWATRRIGRSASIGLLEAMTTGINLLLLTNVYVALELQYSVAKLSYFIMLVMIFGLAWVSLRQSLASIALALGVLYWELRQNDPDQLATYTILSLGAAISAVGITFLLQRALGMAISARQDADSAKQDAERRLARAELLSDAMRHQSRSDSLTSLPNRRAFFEVLADRDGADADKPVWLALLDLDGFKAVNDNYGHVIGDQLLQAVAGRLRDYCGTTIHVSRIGGDEFSFIQRCDSSPQDMESWGDGLLSHLSKTYLIDDRLVQISGSIGCHHADGDDADTRLIQRADYALMHAKRNGKNRVVVFREEHAEDATHRFRIEQNLRIADFAEELELVFQPQFDLGKGRIVCAEALARWNSPELGPVCPDDFIKIAEDCGLVARITLTVLDKTIAMLKDCDDPIPISINLSGRDLLSDQLIDQVIERVRTNGLSPHLIEFEVTETAMMSDMSRASRNLLRLTKLGHPIALDDFGTGYSNFNYLRTLPIGKLKIDRSFLEDLGDPMTEKILHSLAGMARTLDVQCLIEGIESELELVLAKRIGTQLVQGFLFGRPMSAAELSYNVMQNRLARSA